MSATSLKSELNNSIESIHYKPSCSKTTCILPCLGVSLLICFKVYLKAFRKKKLLVWILNIQTLKHAMFKILFRNSLNITTRNLQY